MSLRSAVVVEVGQQQVKGRRNESREANTSENDVFGTLCVHQPTKSPVSFMGLLKIWKSTF